MTTERVLDWRPKWDERNSLYLLGSSQPMVEVPACTNLTRHISILRHKHVWLDQGSEGACTGFGAEHVRALTPYPKETHDAVARLIYAEARRQDEWPGEDYEGSSVNGAMRAERAAGYINHWYWAKTLEQAQHGLSFHGAGELGVWWYTGCFDTDADGFIHVSGNREGGHALALAGYREVSGNGFAFRLENSWGQSWGDNGGCWIWAEDLAQLLTDDGELAFPNKVRS